MYNINFCEGTEIVKSFERPSLTDACRVVDNRMNEPADWSHTDGKDKSVIIYHNGREVSVTKR